MPTYQQAANELRIALASLYDLSEAAAITSHVLHHITGRDKLGRIEIMNEDLTSDHLIKLEKMKERLIQGEPFQYIVGHEFFLGRPFNVSPAVLIPRPETEELVMWIDEDHKARRNSSLKILEVGTGSGCIAISLKLLFPQSTITAIDISEGALEVASGNARRHSADVDFCLLDFVDNKAREALGKFDLIVSNPPYIPEDERGSLHPNVREYEPQEALFVPGNDPLLFYRTICAFGEIHLSPDGAIYCELHQDFGEETVQLFTGSNYSPVLLRNDMSGAARMLRASVNTK